MLGKIYPPAEGSPCPESWFRPGQTTIAIPYDAVTAPPAQKSSDSVCQASDLTHASLRPVVTDETLVTKEERPKSAGQKLKTNGHRLRSEERSS